MGLEGNLAGSLASSLAGNLSGGGPTFAGWVAATKAGLDAIAAGSALHAWVPDAGVTTFNGSNISAIADQWGSANMAQADAGVQPPWLAVGGPGGRPAVDLGTATSRRLTATLPTYAAGNRVSMYCVCVSNDGTQCMVYDPADAVLFYASAIGPTYSLFVDFNVGVSFNAALALPVFDSLYHVRALRPLAAGSLSQFDGSDTTLNPPGDGLIAINAAAIGFATGGSFCGGKVAGVFLINDATAAKDTYFRAQLTVWFGALPA